MRMVRGVPRVQEWGSEEFQDEERQERGNNLYMIFKLENTSGDS